jgi:hypothetical protein
MENKKKFYLKPTEIIEESVPENFEPLLPPVVEEKLPLDKALRVYKLKNPDRALYMKDKEVILKFIQKHISSDVIMTEIQWNSLFDLF